MSPNESDAELRLGETIRAALPPLPADFDPERIEDEFFAALAKENSAVGLKPPDVADRLVSLARRTAGAHRADADRRAVASPRLRRVAAAAAVAAIAGLAGAATVAIRAALRDDPPPAPLPAPSPASSIVRRSSIGVDAPDSAEPDTTKPESSIADPAASAPAPRPAEVVSAGPAASASPAEAVPSASAAPEDAFAFYRPADVETFLAAWQESLLPLSSAVTQEVGAVAICPDSADSAAWFAALWPDRAPETFSALLLDDLGDAVLTNLAASAAAVVEAPEDYDPAWLLDETLPGIPEEHRRALMPFYDPALVTLSFDSYPDAARFAEWLGNGGYPPAPSRTAPSSAPQALLSFETEAHPSPAPQAAPSSAPQALLSFEPQEDTSLAPGGHQEPKTPPMPDFKLLQRLLYRELVVPFYDGPDGSTHLSRDGAREIWGFALELGRGRLALVPNREWGGAYDLVVRSGMDDSFLRFCAAFGSWKWGWADKARELRDDLSFRLAGGDAAPFQSLLLAYLDQRFEPSPDRAVALRAAFDAWAATLAGEFDRDDVRAWFGHWLVEDVVAAGPAPVRGGNACADIRADAIARRAAEPAPDASPAPGAVPVHEDFVQATFLPLVLREVVAPLEAVEGDRDAPWRPMALAALRDWCLWTVRGEDRPDPLYMGRAVSAAGRGCSWPAIRFLAALKDYDDAAWDPETAIYGRPDPAALVAAARRVVEALVTADADPETTPLARLLMHRAAAARRHPPVAGLPPEAFSAAFAAAAAQPRSPAEARALWLLAPDTADWPAIASSASDPWLREMALGRAALTQGDAAKSTAARSGAAQSTTTQSGAAQSTAARSGAARAPLAREAFARAASLRPSFPEPWIELLRHCAADPAEARAFYDEAARREFDAPGAADAMLGALRPASPAGAAPSAPASAEALLAFGDECLATGRFDTRVPFAWVQSRFIAASLPDADWEAPFRGEDAITNMNRVCDARLAHSRSSKDDRADAFYARLWPLYANNNFGAFVPACGAFGSCEGGDHGFTADFDPGHPMRRRALGLAFGYAGYHHDDIVAAMRAWRVDGDLAAARERLRARAGRVSAATNTVDNWEQSFISGRLAVLDCALVRPGETYSLLPKAGTPGPRKFWRSLGETVWLDMDNEFNPDAGFWWTGPLAGQIVSSEPVIPAAARLSAAVGLYPPDSGSHARLWIVPEAVADPSTDNDESFLGLLLERDDHGQCTLGWARLRLFDPDAAPVGEADGPRVRVRPPADGIQPIELDFVSGDIVVRYDGRPIPELRRSGLIAPDRAHAIAFAGRLFAICKATVLALPAEPIAAPESNAVELTDANSPL